MFLSIINLGDVSKYIDIALALIVAIIVIIFTFKSNFSKKVNFIIYSYIIGFAIAYIFGLDLFSKILIVSIICFVLIVTLLLTDHDKERIIRKNKKISKIEQLTYNEVDELVNKLEITVKAFSTTQTGALITIERKDDLAEIMSKSGTFINAPVTPELLGSIFYKGTPLHDGATIIKGNTIIKSAVFYQPTQRPLNGKYGSRHRAAIGISEICDALTIIVSEETGKVSITYKGEITNVALKDFATKFKEFYNQD